MWISRMFIGFSFSENLGEFRIRGFIVGLYLRNISNENLGTLSMFALRGRFEAVKATRMRLMDAGLLASVVVPTSIVYYHLVFTYSSNKIYPIIFLSTYLEKTRRAKGRMEEGRETTN